MIISRLELGMEETSTSNSISNRYAKLLTGSWLTQFRHGSNPWMARYVYSLMFLLANLLAWAVRDYGPSALTEMKSKIYIWYKKLMFILLLNFNWKCFEFCFYLFVIGLKSCQGGKDCLGTEGVLRVSMGCFVSFYISFIYIETNYFNVFFFLSFYISFLFFGKSLNNI